MGLVQIFVGHVLRDLKRGLVQSKATYIEGELKRGSGQPTTNHFGFQIGFDEPTSGGEKVDESWAPKEEMALSPALARHADRLESTSARFGSSRVLRFTLAPGCRT